VTDILTEYAGEFVRKHRAQAVPQVQSTLAKLSLCRTPALGGHVYDCQTCGHRVVVLNSCGDRHCAQCSGAKRRDWLESSAKLLLEGVDYFQVVFTIPDQLSSLALGNRKEMFDLLFHSSWRALKQTIEDEQQFEAAAAMVLHTWNQQLDAHVHVHALVPGGGPSLRDPGTWKKSVPPPHKNPKRPWLVDADTLRLAFRTEFLRGLRSLHRRGLLKLTGDWKFLRQTDEFDSWLRPTEQKSWVTYIQPPPQNGSPPNSPPPNSLLQDSPLEGSSPENVLKYLARYMTGGPISDRRLVSHEDGMVTFTARTGTTTGGSDDTAEVELPGAEFVRRWSLHILPKGYTKTRRYGGYSNLHRQRYMAACQTLLSIDATRPIDATQPEQNPVNETEKSLCCPHCKSVMVCTARTEAPSWRTVMNSPSRPPWYDDG